MADVDLPSSGGDGGAGHDNFVQLAAGGDDAKRLSTIMTELTDMKNDAQQRSWSIYDDSDIIQEYLDEFLVLMEVPAAKMFSLHMFFNFLYTVNLQQADPRGVALGVRLFHSPGQVGKYEIVDTLVVYYQMETRVLLRLRLLRLFFRCVELDADIIAVLQVRKTAT